MAKRKTAVEQRSWRSRSLPCSLWTKTAHFGMILTILVSALVCFPAFNGVASKMADSARMDDEMAISKAPLVTSQELDLKGILQTDFWGTNMYSVESNRSWRPLLTVLFWVQYHVGDGSTLIFRLANVLLRLVLIAVTYLFFRQLSTFASINSSLSEKRGYDGIAACMACLMAAHPMHVDTYALGVGQGDTLSACLVVFAVLVRMNSLHVDLQLGPLRSWTWLQDVLFPSAGFLALCVLAGTAKEIGAMLVPVLCFMDAIAVAIPAMALQRHALGAVARGKHFARCAVLTASWAALMYVRLRVVQPGPPAMPRSSNFIAAHPSFVARSLTLWWAAAWHFTSVLAPTSITSDRGDTCLQAITSLKDFRNVTTLSFLAALGVIAAGMAAAWRRWARAEATTALAALGTQREKKRTVKETGEEGCSPVAAPAAAGVVLAASSCCIMALVTFLPSSNLLFTVGFVVAERIMLLPSIGVMGGIVVAGTAWAEYSAHSAGPSTGSGTPEHAALQRTNALWQRFLPGVIVVFASMAFRSVTYHYSLNNVQQHFEHWLQVCPRSQRAWLASAALPDVKHFALPAQADISQRGCHSNVGWLHDCSSQRGRLFTHALGKLALPPTNCSHEPYAGCHPYVHDMSQPAPTHEILLLQELCERSPLSKFVPAPYESLVRVDTTKQHARIRSIPFKIMSATERLVCAAVFNPDKQMPQLLLSSYRLSSDKPEDVTRLLQLLHYIQESFLIRKELGVLEESMREDYNIMLLATFLQVQHLLPTAAFQHKQPSEKNAELQRVLLQYGAVATKSPAMLLNLFVQSSKSPDPLLQSARSSAATSSVVIAGATDPPDFLVGITSMLLSVQLQHAKQYSLALQVLAQRFNESGCARQQQAESGGLFRQDMICSYCPLYTLLAQAHHHVSQLVAATEAELAVREAKFVADLGMQQCTLGRNDELAAVQQDVHALVSG